MAELPSAGAATGRSLDAGFFERDVREVAHDLVGCLLLHEGVGGVIVETEAYDRDDPACHAYNGPTPRNRVLFGPPGIAYVYLSYGIHSLLNAVAEPDGDAAAVLIRALEPTIGINQMVARRGQRSIEDLCSGPGKLTEALGVGLDRNGMSLSEPPFELYEPEGAAHRAVVSGPRIGISKAVDFPWRYCAAGSRFVSQPRPR